MLFRSQTGGIVGRLSAVIQEQGTDGAPEKLCGKTDGGKVFDSVFGADAGGGDVEAVRGVTIWRE